jgi:hypothetical protein
MSPIVTGDFLLKKNEVTILIMKYMMIDQRNIYMRMAFFFVVNQQVSIEMELNHLFDILSPEM